MKGTRPLVRVAAALSLVTAVLSASMSSSAQADAGAATSARTLSGTGEFAGLAVTVSQTDNLVNQVVRVTWTGGKQSAPTTGSFGSNYLQIMQCWGDGPTGPDREQCQYGGNYIDNRGGNWTSTRQTSYGSGLVDPLETYQAADSVHQAYVPFHAVNGVTTTDVPNQFFDQYSTNEINYARTSADGTGQEFFEVETAREASGLGCGERLAGNKARGCWLVVIPRGGTEVDGKALVDTPYNKQSSSPLSATNWAHRIVFPLGFQPIGLSCALGSAERKIVGQESIEEPVSRWQPTLCSRTGNIYGFSRVSDDLARGQLLSNQPGLVLVSKPAATDSTVSDLLHPSYAPVGLNGLVIAVNIDQQSAYGAPASVKETDGRRIPSLRLNARLVAKMLTQSYQAATASANLIPNNPFDLTHDKEFLALNPDFSHYFYSGLTDITVPLGLSDATSVLWAWIAADPAASAFLKGKPDPYGAVVNPSYKSLDLPRPDFPKSDPACQQYYDQPPLCTLDAHAYSNDMHEGCRGAARGDSLSRGFFDRTASPPQYKRVPPQLSGSRAVLALCDWATAARYKLVTAQLQNRAGEFVAPSVAGLTAAVGAMSRSATPGVLLPNPGAKVKTAYPLTSLTYAATVPQLLSKAEATDYAAFVDYAVGDGQTPGEGAGQLPDGAVPLPAALRSQSKAAAQAWLAQAGKGVPTAAPTPTVVQPTAPSLSPGQPVTSAPAIAPAPLPSVSGPAGPTSAPASGQPMPQLAPQPLLSQAGITAASPLGASRYGLVLLIVLGAAALLAGSFLRNPTRPPSPWWRGSAGSVS